jgi:lambda repressor-like predicted transcriptional regulator
MDQLRTTLHERLAALGLSARQASLRAGLSHNTLRVVLAGARPTPETCDALEPVLQLAPGTLRLLAGWPVSEQRRNPEVEYALQLLRTADPTHRQAAIAYLLVSLTPRLPGRQAVRRGGRPPGASAAAPWAR